MVVFALLFRKIVLFSLIFSTVFISMMYIDYNVPSNKLCQSLEYSNILKTDSGTVLELVITTNASIFYLSGEISIYYFLKVVEFGENVSKIVNVSISIEILVLSKNFKSIKTDMVEQFYLPNQTIGGRMNFYLSARDLNLDYGEKTFANVIYNLTFYEEFYNSTEKRLYNFSDKAFSIVLISRVRLFRDIFEMVIILLSGTLLILIPLILIEIYKRRSKKRKVFLRSWRRSIK